MELRRFLLDREITQIAVIREAVKAGYRIHAPDVSAIVRRREPAQRALRVGIVNGLLALGVLMPEIDQIDELKERPDGRGRKRREAKLG